MAAAALEELLSGPSAEEEAAGLGSAVPDGTELRSVTIADGVATVDLSATYESGGGSASMLARVAQVVYTATQFPTVDAVRFRLDGEPVEAIGGEGVVVDPPVGRGDFEALLPPILVETPAVAEVVTSPLRVAGTASVFEATLIVTLTGPDGATLAEQVVTATEGAPSRGDFETTLEFDAPAGPATVTAFTRSAADNSVQHAVEIPVELAG